MIKFNTFKVINSLSYFLVSKIRKIYLSSSVYNKRISKVKSQVIEYKPKLNILDCLIKYKKKKFNIEEIQTSKIWDNMNINSSSYKKLNNFFWLFTIDLKSSSEVTQSIINRWIDKNHRYNDHNWDLNVLSKRIISWISNSKLTYDNGNDNYKYKFNFSIKKQINHLINEINSSQLYNDKMFGCTAIILCGLSFKDENYLSYGRKLLKDIINYSFDDEGFPKTRNFRQLIFFLKHFVLIRELFKDAQHEIPDYLNEIIFYAGQGYNLLWQKSKQSILYNGSQELNNDEFDKYLKTNGYKFNSETNLIGGYAQLSNKQIFITMDLGNPPEKKFSNNYQSGALSFEFSYLGEKVICNSGYFQKLSHRLNSISRLSVSHSTLNIDNCSSVSFNSTKDGSKIINRGFNILSRKINKKSDCWVISGAHDSYLKNYGLIHERELKYYDKTNTLNGLDILKKSKDNNKYDFEIRFHLYPGAKVTKTIDRKTILIEINNSGWKFSCFDDFIDIETGLYFGKKNKYIENTNIFIYGKTSIDNKNINWELKKI